MGGDEVHITISGELVQRLREVQPSGTLAVGARVEKIVAEWVKNKAAEKEAAELRRTLRTEKARPWQEVRKELNL